MEVRVLMVTVQDKGEMVMRAYTPTSCDDDVGYFDLVVKVYFANNNPAFPLVSYSLRQAPLLHPSEPLLFQKDACTVCNYITLPEVVLHSRYSATLSCRQHGTMPCITFYRSPCLLSFSASQ